MRYCSRCILPDSRPGIFISSNGVCNACNNFTENKENIDFSLRESQFMEVVKRAKAKSKGYDCLIPVSGGKDSTWQVVKCLEYGLNILAVTWKTPARTKIGQANLDNLISLGVDHIDYTINPLVEKKFMLKALEKYGSTAIPMHMAMFAIPTRISANFGIPLVVWGENSAFEYGTDDEALTGFKLDSKWLKKYGVTNGTTAEDWISGDLTLRELTPYFSLTDDEIDKAGVNAIFLGYYFKWDVETSLNIATSNGFQLSDQPKTGIYTFADIDDDFISIHHFLKWYKFGITRSFDNLSLEIRNKRITREEALKKLALLGDETPYEDIRKFCAFTGITEDRFFNICEKFRNSAIWKKEKGTWKIEGFINPYYKWNNPVNHDHEIC
jgi:N-acetyl sugar amidotransferase